MSYFDVVMVPRIGVQEWIDQYAAGKISYLDMERGIAAQGYSTRSLYEMVRHINPKRVVHSND